MEIVLADQLEVLAQGTTLRVGMDYWWDTVVDISLWSEVVDEKKDLKITLRFWAQDRTNQCFESHPQTEPSWPRLRQTLSAKTLWGGFNSIRGISSDIKVEKGAKNRVFVRGPWDKGSKMDKISISQVGKIPRNQYPASTEASCYNPPAAVKSLNRCWCQLSKWSSRKCRSSLFWLTRVLNRSQRVL